MKGPEPPPGSGASAVRARLELKLGSAQRESGDLAAATEALARAFASAQLSGDGELLIAAGRELGITLLAASRLSRAELLLRQTLRATAEHYGEQSPEWAAAAEDLALALRARGDVSAAVRLQREALETARSALGERDPMTLIIDVNLASATNVNRLLVPLSGLFVPHHASEEREGEAYKIVRGFFTRARPAFERGTADLFLPRLRDLREAESTSDTQTAAWAVSMVDWLLLWNPDPEHAGEGYRLARRIWAEYRVALGEHHPQTLNSMVLVSRAAAPGDIDHAVELGREAAEASEQVLGRGHLDTLSAYETLAGLYQLRGAHAAAGDLRRENILLRAEDEGIIGDAQPPIENLAGTLTEPLALLAKRLAPSGPSGKQEEELLGDVVAAVAFGQAPPTPDPDLQVGLGEERSDEVTGELVTRIAHVELEPSRAIEPYDRFEVGVYVDSLPATGEESSVINLKPLAGVAELDLRVWLVVSRHFEIEGPAVQPLHIDLRDEVSSRLIFAVRAAHVGEFGDEDPEVRVLFSYRDWPSGEVRRTVPLSQPAAESAR